MPSAADAPIPTLHLVCPHCAGINRVPAARLDEQPTCGRCRQPLFTGAPLVFEPADLDRHLTRSDLPLIVDFWAPWCGPCRSMAPAFAAAAAALEPRIRLAKLDTEAHPDSAGRFAVRSIPTLVAFRAGREIARHSGAIDAHAISTWARRTFAT